jgi:hypothetical protein
MVLCISEPYTMTIDRMHSYDISLSNNSFATIFICELFWIISFGFLEFRAMYGILGFCHIKEKVV